jgi:ribosomal protein S18 acetylase RimI-like enzyme
MGLYFLKPNQVGLGSHVCNVGYMVGKTARGRGLGEELCRHSLSTARDLAYTAMQFNLVVSTNVGAVRLWQKMGFNIMATLPQAYNHATQGLVSAHVMYKLIPPFSTGNITIRPAIVTDAPALAKILTETNRATFAGIVPSECLNDPTLADSERNWRRTLGDLGDLILLVAENQQGNMLGYALVGDKTDHPIFSRELHVLMVAPNHQRQGIGRLLVARASKAMKRLGASGLTIAVHSQNPNTAFYEHLGATQIGTRPFTWAGHKMQAILYGLPIMSPNKFGE